MSKNIGAYSEEPDIGAWQHITEAVASAIAKVNGIAKASLSKILGIEI